MSKIELGILAALGLGGALVFALWWMGRDHVRLLALLLIAGLLMIGLVGMSALPIRAYRKKDATGETHHYVHDGTKTIVRERVLDGRAQGDVRLLQLPQTGSQAVFPEMLSAAYRSGMLARQSQATVRNAGDDDGEVVDGEVLREWEPGEWDGEINDK